MNFVAFFRTFIAIPCARNAPFLIVMRCGRATIKARKYKYK